MQSPDYFGEAYFERSVIEKSMGKMAQYKSDLRKANELGYSTPKAMK